MPNPGAIWEVVRSEGEAAIASHFKTSGNTRRRLAFTVMHIPTPFSLSEASNQAGKVQ